MTRNLIETLERRELFAASTLSDTVEAWVLMNCPNDFKATTPPPYVVEQFASRLSLSSPKLTDMAGATAWRCR